MSLIRRPWMLLIATWLGAAVIGSFMGCSDNSKTETAAPPPPPKKKSTESTQKQAPVVLEEDTTPKVIAVSDKDVAKLQPGLALRFLDSGGANAKVIDARGVRLAALHVPASTPHSTMLPAGQFHATLNGYIKQRIDGEVSFKLVGAGDAKLYINGKLVATMKDGKGEPSAKVPLAQGFNQLDVRYASPVNDNSSLRVYWKGDEPKAEFGWEPIPPAIGNGTTILYTRSDDADFSAGQEKREGRMLFATLNCAQCHGLPSGVQQADSKMPEMQQQGPSLENAGNRFNENWLVEWIKDPHAMRPDATMPKVVHGPEAEKDAKDIASYVVSKLKEGRPLPEKTKPTEELSEAGDKLFKQLGCIACHNLTDPEAKEPDEFNRVSLFYVGAKFKTGALEDFLRDPYQHNPWLRMADFKFNLEEREALTSFLLDYSEGELGPATGGNPVRGKELFEKVGCAQCHSTTLEPLRNVKPMVAFPKDLKKGCLTADEKEESKAPDYDLTNSQRQALRSFLRTDGKSLTREVAAEYSMRQMKAMQCNACHSRDGTASRWYIVMEKEGAGLSPEQLPLLTWTGQKLQVPWIENMLAGNYEASARHWLKARMPAFPLQGKLLASGLSHEHGYADFEDPGRPLPDVEMEKIGEELMQGGNSGFNCKQCHARGPEKAVSPDGKEGINFADAAVRLRYEYYQRWMHNLNRIDPQAGMTQVPIVDGKTELVDVLDGDARRQFEAIWLYMQKLPTKDGK